ncbi:hypothetical protein ACFOVU_18975 [Nocardiopsis sediminis]|uniref:ATP-binding protein n=1 Tax=Nocardiopsis sediminis TaxID=1778267 RepID=A0ABV8FSP2_9ACTN
MFQFVRTTTKAVLVAAGTAGFVALGAGIAGADALGVSDTLAPQASVPTAQGLPNVVGGVQSLVQGVDTPDLGTTLPAPATRNVTAPGGDISGVSPFLQERIDGTQGVVDGARSELGLSDVEHQTAQGELTGLLPEAPGTGVVPVTEGLPAVPDTATLPLANELPTSSLANAPEATRIALPRLAGEAEGAVDKVTGELTTGLADGVSEGVSSHLEEHQPENRITVHGLDTTELPVVGDAPQVDEGVGTVAQALPAAETGLTDGLSSIDAEAAASDVVQGAVDSTGVTGVRDLANGIGTPAL